MKNISGITEKIGERVYHFVCDVDAPLGEIHDALCAFKKFVVERISAQQASEAPTVAPEPTPE